MSAGITRVNGTAATGASFNVTGEKSFFIGGYQPLFVTLQTVHATVDMVGSGATLYSTVNSTFEKVIRTCETVGTVVGYGVPATSAGTDTVVVIFDAGSVNQGSGAGGQSGATTGFGALKDALAGVAGNAGNYTLTTYTGFTGGVLGNNA
jgi:hypothetical protein